jgi:hypothetical protein
VKKLILTFTTLTILTIIKNSYCMEKESGKRYTYSIEEMYAMREKIKYEQTPEHVQKALENPELKVIKKIKILKRPKTIVEKIVGLALYSIKENAEIVTQNYVNLWTRDLESPETNVEEKSQVTVYEKPFMKEAKKTFTVHAKKFPSWVPKSLVIRKIIIKLAPQKVKLAEDSQKLMFFRIDYATRKNTIPKKIVLRPNSTENLSKDLKENIELIKNKMLMLKDIQEESLKKNKTQNKSTENCDTKTCLHIKINNN